MVEDTPHDLVHDLAGEAVFGGHPLGRPVIGRAEVISTVSRRALAAYHRRAYVGANDRPRGGGERPSTSELVELLDAHRNGALEPAAAPAAEAGAPRARRRSSASSARTRSSTTSASARRGSRERTSAASPPRCSTRSSAAPRRPGSSRRSGRSAAWRTRCTATRSQYSDSGQLGAVRRARARTTWRRASRSRSPSSPTSPPATFAPRELARAKENLKGRLLLSLESTSNRMTRLGKATVTETPLPRHRRDRPRIEAVDGRRGRRARRRAARARAALRRRDRARRGALPGRRRARQPRARSRTRPPEGRRSSAPTGRWARVLAPGARGSRPRGRRRRDSARWTAATPRSTSRGPTRSRRTCARCLAAGVPVVIGTTGLRRRRRRRARPARRASRASTRRTSRSARC